MKEILTTVVQAMGDQAIALGTVTDSLTGLKQRLAKQFPELADELKAEIQEEQTKSRAEVYELQVSLAKLRQAIAGLPEPKVVGKRKSA